MKLNKKGMTLVELIISVALLSVIVGFLYKILLDVKYESDDAGFAIKNQVSRSEILKTIQYDFEDLGVLDVAQSGSTITFEFNNEETKTLEVNETTIKYGSQKWTLKDNNYTFGEISLDNSIKDYWKITIPVISIDGTNESSADDIILFTKYKELDNSNYLRTIILNHAKSKGYLYSTKPDFSQITQDGEYGIYKTDDNYGTSYYFRGDVENNYVRFGNYSVDETISVVIGNDSGDTQTIISGDAMYWRIVRINGDGTVRLVYDGINGVSNGVNHIATIGGARYNSTATSLEDLQYSYDNNGIVSDSFVKEFLDTWFDDHLKSDYGQYIENSANFCNDNTIYTEETVGIYNKKIYYYNTYNNILSSNPNLKCEANYSHINPVGLLSSDEVMIAGGVYGTANQNYYLYSGAAFWTMSPVKFDETNTRYANAYNYMVTASGDFGIRCITQWYNVRPVINLKANVTATGTGTLSDPYVIDIN